MPAGRLLMREPGGPLGRYGPQRAVLFLRRMPSGKSLAGTLRPPGAKLTKLATSSVLFVTLIPACSEGDLEKGH